MDSSPLSRSEQKRAQILEAAISLFCKHGLSNTSMDGVAKKAGVSKQTVYSHFGSKDELFVASIKSRCVIQQMSQELLVNPLTPEQVLTEFGEYLGEMILSPEHLELFKTCVAESDSHPELSVQYFNSGPQYLLLLLEDYFGKVEQLGEFNFGHRHYAAVQLYIMLFGEMRLRLELGLPADDIKLERTDYIKSCVSMFLRAYSSKK